jgi:hypothetical protein
MSDVNVRTGMLIQELGSEWVDNKCNELLSNQLTITKIELMD